MAQIPGSRCCWADRRFRFPPRKLGRYVVNRCDFRGSGSALKPSTLIIHAFSLCSQSAYRISFRRPPRRQVASEGSHSKDQECDRCEGGGICRSPDAAAGARASPPRRRMHSRHPSPGDSRRLPRENQGGIYRWRICSLFIRLGARILPMETKLHVFVCQTFAHHSYPEFDQKLRELRAIPLMHSNLGSAYCA